LEGPKCTKIKQLLRHKAFCLKDVGLLTHEYVLEGKRLRKEILNKIHHSLYIIHPGSIKMYKDEEGSELEFSTYFSSSSLQATFGMPPYETFYGVKC
jgi:hypothetical protein